MANAFYGCNRLLLFSSLQLPREGLWGDLSWREPRGPGPVGKSVLSSVASGVGRGCEETKRAWLGGSCRATTVGDALHRALEAQGQSGE